MYSSFAAYEQHATLTIPSHPYNNLISESMGSCMSDPFIKAKRCCPCLSVSLIGTSSYQPAFDLYWMTTCLPASVDSQPTTPHLPSSMQLWMGMPKRPWVHWCHDAHTSPSSKKVLPSPKRWGMRTHQQKDLQRKATQSSGNANKGDHDTMTDVSCSTEST
jgi:hypothetical protein